MARTILVFGESGHGKTTAMRTLDPEHTLYIDCDKKGLCWKGWKSKYSVEKKNYMATSNDTTIRKFFQRVHSGDLKNTVDVIVIDTINGIMNDFEMSHSDDTGFKKWVDLATIVYRLIDEALALRDNLTVVFVAHAQRDSDDTGYTFTHAKTNGRKLEKIVLESKFTTVLYARHLSNQDEQPNHGYVFETQANNSTAKSPMGCFEPVIPNDMQFVIDTLKKYEEE